MGGKIFWQMIGNLRNYVCYRNASVTEQSNVPVLN